jgi:hypothetical protein
MELEGRSELLVEDIDILAGTVGKPEDGPPVTIGLDKALDIPEPELGPTLGSVELVAGKGVAMDIGELGRPAPWVVLGKPVDDSRVLVPDVADGDGGVVVAFAKGAVVTLEPMELIGPLVGVVPLAGGVTRLLVNDVELARDCEDTPVVVIPEVVVLV